MRCPYCHHAETKVLIVDREFSGVMAEALKLARTGLSRACRVPLDYSPTNETHFSNLATLKRLALALAAEGRLAELENRPADAAAAYLATIRLGQAVCRGGVTDATTAGGEKELIKVSVFGF